MTLLTSLGSANGVVLGFRQATIRAVSASTACDAVASSAYTSTLSKNPYAALCCSTPASFGAPPVSRSADGENCGFSTPHPMRSMLGEGTGPTQSTTPPRPTSSGWSSLGPIAVTTAGSSAGIDAPGAGTDVAEAEATEEWFAATFDEFALDDGCDVQPTPAPIASTIPS